MRKFTLLTLLTFFIGKALCQDMYSKYNSYLNRYEYFDTYGELIGYKKYNSYTKTWEYFKNKPVNNDVNLSDVAVYSGKVQAQLQARYDYNLKRISISMEALINKVKTSSITENSKKRAIDFFVENYVKPLDSKKLNMTDTNVITQAIVWLNNNMDEIIDFYIEQEAKLKKQ